MWEHAAKQGNCNHAVESLLLDAFQKSSVTILKDLEEEVHQYLNLCPYTDLERYLLTRRIILLISRRS